MALLPKCPLPPHRVQWHCYLSVPSLLTGLSVALLLKCPLPPHRVIGGTVHFCRNDVGDKLDGVVDHTMDLWDTPQCVSVLNLGAVPVGTCKGMVRRRAWGGGGVYGEVGYGEEGRCGEEVRGGGYREGGMGRRVR